MHIYQDSTQTFVNDIRENRLTDIMSQSFEFSFGRKVGASEANSWQNSLSRVRDLIEMADLKDNYIALEYQVPFNQSRIDCLLFGKDQTNNSNVLLIELKQWSDVEALEDEGNFVETFTGGRKQVVAHPSQQVKGYNNYLKGFISAFEATPPLLLLSCSYCHNYNRHENQGLYDPIYKKLIEEFPVYSKEDVRVLADKIKSLLSNGGGFEIFNRFMQSPIKPSKKLLENVAKVVKNEVSFSLLNEQLVAKNLIWSKVRKAKKNKEKSVILVHGGPGTGKSVIAVNILAEAAQKEKHTSVFYGCKSKPFIEGMKSLVKGDGKMLFSNLFRFLPSKVSENELDLVLIDEAHRIERNSNHQYTKPEDRTDMPQVEQLIRCSKTTVFFIDDKQNVRSQEIGSSDLIREAAQKFNCVVSEVTLVTQYRCMGSNDYLLWLESALGYTSEKRLLKKNEVFDFKIVESPEKLYQFLKSKEDTKPNSARLVAGFCWKWSDPDEHGNLVNDVVIGDFAMPWEAKDGFRLAKGLPKWYEWAYKPGGINQIGCIYTAQGFEFDYVGVIIGDDIYYDRETKSLQTNIKATSDPTLKRYANNFDEHVRNIYRTLLSRGMQGCYVYFVNKDTEEYFKSLIEQ